MQQKKGVWVGFVSLIVIAALGLWWLSASRPLGFSLTQTPTSTVATSTTEAAAPSPTSPTAAVKSAKPAVSASNTSKKTQDVVTIVKGLSNASTFNSYFRSTGVAATISPTSVSKYTIFVPTNGAFSQLAPGTVANLSADEKKRLIQYHVVSGRAMDVDALVAGSVQSLSGDPLNFSYGPNKIPMVNSSIVVSQIEGKNGVVIVIDNVLLPPKRTF